MSLASRSATASVVFASALLTVGLSAHAVSPSPAQGNPGSGPTSTITITPGPGSTVTVTGAPTSTEVPTATPVPTQPTTTSAPAPVPTTTSAPQPTTTSAPAPVPTTTSAPDPEPTTTSDPEPTTTSAPAPTTPTHDFHADVNADSWQVEVIERSAKQRVVVDFWATWCGPCKRLAPVITKAAEDDKSWFLAKVDADKNRDLAKQHDVRLLPDLWMYSRGNRVGHYMGSYEIEHIMGWLRRQAGVTPSPTRPAALSVQ